MKTFFIAGVMQGSRLDNGMQSQSYRDEIKKVLKKHIEQVKVICPYEENPDSTEYSDDKGKDVFLRILKQAASVDVLIAYLPEASMGTALEIWEAYNHNVEVWIISALKNNWVVKFFSHKIFDSIEDIDKYLQQKK